MSSWQFFSLILFNWWLLSFLRILNLDESVSDVFDCTFVVASNMQEEIQARWVILLSLADTFYHSYMCIQEKVQCSLQKEPSDSCVERWLLLTEILLFVYSLPGCFWVCSAPCGDLRVSGFLNPWVGLGPRQLLNNCGCLRTESSNMVFTAPQPFLLFRNTSPWSFFGKPLFPHSQAM